MRNDPMGRVEDDIDEAVSTARTVKDDAISAAQSMKDSAGEVAENVQTALVKAVKEQPMMALAIVAALGFAVGALRKT